MKKYKHMNKNELNAAYDNIMSAGDLPHIIKESQAGENIGLMHIPKATHFSMLNDLTNPDGWQIKALMNM